MAAATATPPWASLGHDTTPLLDKWLVLELQHDGFSKTSLLDPKPAT
jgi:hypothetical protein